MNKRSPFISLVTAIALVVSLCSGILITDRARAATAKSSAKASGGGSDRNAKGNKVSPSLTQSKGRKSSSGDRVDVILQIDGKVSGQLNALLNRNGVHVNRHFKSFNSFAVQLPSNVIEELATFSEVKYISLDAETRAAGHATASVDTGRPAAVQALMPPSST